MEKLKVGDKIYQENYGKITGVFTIERLTKTFAISRDDNRFRIEYTQPDWIVYAGDAGRFSSNHYSLETPELIMKLYRQRSIDKIKNADFTKLSTDEIRSIMNFIN